MKAIAIALLLVAGFGEADRASVLPVEVALRVIQGTTVEVIVVNRSSRQLDTAVSSSFTLGRSERESFWAPFDPSTGVPYDMSVEICGHKPIGPKPSPPRLKLEPRESRRLTIQLRDLMWARQISSVWPNLQLDAIVPSGRYPLVWELSKYGADATAVRSAVVRVEVVRK